MLRQIEEYREQLADKEAALADKDAALEAALADKDAALEAALADKDAVIAKLMAQLDKLMKRNSSDSKSTPPVRLAPLLPNYLQAIANQFIYANNLL